MTLTINLPQATVELLQAEAQVTGKDVQTIVRDAVAARLARRKQTFAEVLKPIQDAVEGSGLSEEDVTALFDESLKSVRAERASGRTPP